MTDDRTPETTGDPAGDTASEPGSQQGTRPLPRSGSQAASRARRIGGRPQPGAGPAAADPAGPEPGDVPEAALKRRTATARESRRSKRATAPVPAARGTRGGTTAGGDTAGWVVTAVLAAVVVGLLVWGAALSHGVWWAKSSSTSQSERGAVLASAQGCMATMNSYDYRKLAQAQKRGLACTTGALSTQYRDAMDKLIKPQAGKVKFTQSAQVNAAGIESVSPNGKQWVVLIFGQLSSTNSATGSNTPQLAPFSARVTMQKAHGRWLVANYQYAPPISS